MTRYIISFDEKKNNFFNPVLLIANDVFLPASLNLFLNCKLTIVLSNMIYGSLLFH